MTTLLTCLLLAILLPYLAKAPVAAAMAKLDGYDNRHPRAQQAKLTGYGARALAAHQNAFESLLVFGIAVVTVIAADKVNDVAITLAIVHVAARLAYHLLYLLNYSSLRSTAWFIAIGASLGIFAQAL
ncbi:MAPEG family protein [Shewanella sp. SR44-3]|uniref:MAPEG family protein n=1 Tax=unclassified Shewanella TaxID=196818 RepID=UPI0015F9A4EB|nr:MAPEG family protein [Shewanella sp. SR44-3]MBB1269534.1 MAPEG family protein [Shewanella sp. SR44-3]